MQIKILNLCFCLLLGLSTAASADCRVFNKTEKTIAGVLRIINVGNDADCSRYAITLNGKTILNTDSNDAKDRFGIYPIPHIQKHFRKPAAGFDEVIFFTQNDGANLCDFEYIWFLGLNRDGSYNISNNEDICATNEIIVKQKDNKIFVTIPAGTNGFFNPIPMGNWVYSNGVIHKQ